MLSENWAVWRFDTSIWILAGYAPLWLDVHWNLDFTVFLFVQILKVYNDNLFSVQYLVIYTKSIQETGTRIICGLKNVS